MNKSLKEIGMSKKEQAFREAGYEYTKHLNGSIRNKLLLEIAINPIFGAAIYTAYRASTPKGEELKRRQYETGKAYKAEIDAYRSNR